MDDAGSPPTPREAAETGKRARPRYNAAGKQIVEMCVGAYMGYRPIMAKCPEVGFAIEGLKSAYRMSRNSGAMDRAKGSRSTRARRKHDTSESARQYMEENPGSSRGDAAPELDLPKTTIRTALKEDLDTRPLRQLTAQRAKPANAQERLDICKIRGDRPESGKLVVENISFTGEKLFRPGACSGGIRISPRT